MPSVCEVCGRIEDTDMLDTEEHTLFMSREVLIVCEDCLKDRQQPS